MKRSVVIALLIALAGCSGPEHISVAEFKRDYALAGQPQSMQSIDFMGVRDGKAFLRIRSMPVVGSKWKERLVYVELTEVDDELRDLLTKRPNQALEPTAMLVTPRAGARVAPSTAVAHL